MSGDIDIEADIEYLRTCLAGTTRWDRLDRIVAEVSRLTAENEELLTENEAAGDCHNLLIRAGDESALLRAEVLGLRAVVAAVEKLCIAAEMIMHPSAAVANLPVTVQQWWVTIPDLRAALTSGVGTAEEATE